MDEKLRFHVLVMLLAETYDLEDSLFENEIDKFEELISEAGGKAWFQAAKSDYNDIEITTYKDMERLHYYAEYYDGYQAPFVVCDWDKPIKELEELLKLASPILYKEYIVRIK